ncbi:MAG: DotA/TraY family protein [Methylococcales bacterium]
MPPPFRSPVFILAIFFAYYLPALPFILWMSAVAGLMIMVVEVMVAAPIWIVAHALPEGDGMAGNQAKQGYMMYLSLTFRAPLMVVGFFASYIMIQSFSWLLGKSFMILCVKMRVKFVS